MPLDNFRRGLTTPGWNPAISTTYDASTVARVLTLWGVVGLSDLGLRYPYNRDASESTPITSPLTLNSFRNEYDTFEIQGTTVTCGVSPIWIACRRFVMDSTAILDADGKGGTGGAGGTGATGSGADGQAADLYGSSSMLLRGLGGAGGGGSSESEVGAEGGGGDGGRGGANNDGGNGGAAGGPGDTGTQGTAHNLRDILQDFLPLIEVTRGGAGGGGGGSTSTSVAGGAGGNGGGGILITCEEFDCDPAAIIRARGVQGSQGTNGVLDGGNGGGGSGGWVLVMTVRKISEPIFQVTAGAAQTGGSGGDGAAGRDGAYHLEYVDV